jgi:exopolysaccharide biosynthesis polyprenyl glycosylphosphotransferase
MATQPQFFTTGEASALAGDRVEARWGLDAALAPKLVAPSYGPHDYYLRRLLALGDIAAIILALATALVLTGVDSPGPHLLIGLITLPGWLVLFQFYGLYERDAKRIAHTTIDDIPGLFHAVLLGGVLTWLCFQVVPVGKLTFIPLLLFAGLVLLVCLIVRLGARAAVRHMFAPERVVLIGTGQTTRMLVESLRGDPRCHVQIVGRLIASEQESDDGPLPVLGRLHVEGLARTLAEHRVGRVLVANGELDQPLLTQILRDCKPLSVKVSLLPEGFSVMGPSVEVEDIRGLTVFGINPPVLSRSSRWAKRCLDVLGAGIALLVFFPVLTVLALLVRLGSPGPALFRQERIGQDGRRFKLLKLRTMDEDAERRRAELLAQSRDSAWLHLEHDPRITRFGRVLRLTSIDELPQLWNVLRGHMSLVGPRPLVPEEDMMVAAWARGRLDLTPGITGLWQVLGRTSITFEEMVKLDYLYVTNWSLWGDVRLILRTLPVVLRRTGAN